MSSAAPPPAVRLSGRLTVRRVALLVGLGVLTAALLVALGGGRAALVPLAEVRWGPLLLAALLHYASFAVRGHRWQTLLRIMGHRLRYTTVTALLLAGWFTSAVVPMRPGDVLRVLVLRSGAQGHLPVPVPDSLGSIVLERVLDILAIVLLGALFGFLALQATLPPWVLLAYGTAALALLAFLVALLVAPAVMGWLQMRSGRRWWQATVGFLARFVAGLRALRRAPGRAALAVAESLLVWLVDALLLWLVLRSLGQTVPFGPAAFVALTVDIVAAVPLTPGGVGPIEVAFAALLALIGVAPNVATAAVLLVRGISYWSFLLFTGLVTAATGFAALLAAPPAEAPAEPAAEPAVAARTAPAALPSDAEPPA